MDSQDKFILAMVFLSITLLLIAIGFSEFMKRVYWCQTSHLSPGSELTLDTPEPDQMPTLVVAETTGFSFYQKCNK